MEGSFEIPEMFASYFEETDEANKYKVREWKSWISRTPMFFSSIVLAAPDKQTYSSHLIAIYENRYGEPSLMIHQLLPEAPDIFWQKRPAVIVTFKHVENAFVFKTTIYGKICRSLIYEGESAVEIMDLYECTVKLANATYVFPERHKAEISLSFTDEWIKGVPDELSRSEVIFIPKSNINLGKEQIQSGRTTLSLGPSAPVVTCSADVVKAEGEYQFKAIFKDIRHNVEQDIVNFIDDRWLDKAKVEIRRRKEALIRAKDDMARVYRKNLHKTHYYLLSDDMNWNDQLAEIGVVRRIEDIDIDYVIDEISNERCDVLVVDYDYWEEWPEELLLEIIKDKTASTIPFFWITNKPSKIKNKENYRKLILNHAFDVLDRDMPEKEVALRMNWSFRQPSLGEGDAMMLISTNEKNIYKLGIALQGNGYKIIKSTSLTNPVSALNKYRPGWIIVDGHGIGSSYDMILRAVLNWCKRAEKQRGIFLLSNKIDSQSFMDWINAGLTDIIYMDNTLKEITRRIFEKIREFNENKES